MNWFLRSGAPKPPIAVVLQKRVTQKCQIKGFILIESFALGKRVESLEHTFLKGLQRQEGSTSQVVYFLSIPNGPYIVQTVYFQVTTVY